MNRDLLLIRKCVELASNFASDFNVALILGVLSRISSGKQYSPNHAVPLKRRRFELDVVNESLAISASFFCSSISFLLSNNK